MPVCGEPGRVSPRGVILATLFLVRHGQTAGFLTGAYTDLTPLGVGQARAFGGWCAARGLRPDRVVVGPRERHEQTWLHACEAAGGDWPAPTRDDGLDEHHGFAVVAHAVSGGAGTVGVALREAIEAGEPRGVLRAFRHLTDAWAAGEVAAPDDEDWAAFTRRVSDTLGRLCGADRGGVTFAFTSGGFVGVASALAAGVEDTRRVVDFAFAVENTAHAELRFATTAPAPRPVLHRFNVAAHLGPDTPATGI